MDYSEIKLSNFVNTSTDTNPAAIQIAQLAHITNSTTFVGSLITGHRSLKKLQMTFAALLRLFVVEEVFVGHFGGVDAVSVEGVVALVALGFFFGVDIIEAPVVVEGLGTLGGEEEEHGDAHGECYEREEPESALTHVVQATGDGAEDGAQQGEDGEREHGTEETDEGYVGESVCEAVEEQHVDNFGDDENNEAHDAEIDVTRTTQTP